eukprot:symbB.v1.2.016900.t1/scaffold1302.1/size209015/8
MQACLDTNMQDRVGAYVGAAPCKNEFGNQEVEIQSSGTIRLPLTGFCLGPAKDCHKKPAKNDEDPVSHVKCHVALADCGGHDATKWMWSIPVDSRKGLGQVKHQSTQLCLELENQNWVRFDLRLAPCLSRDAEDQLWVWDDLVKSQEL